MVVGAEVTAFSFALIPVESEPAHAVEDGLAGLFGIAFLVGVFDAENKGATMFASKEPVEEGGASSADVEVTGGRGCEACANGHERALKDEG